MAARRAALLWAGFAIPAALYGMAWAQQSPSIAMEYCASVNTADMEPRELPCGLPALLPL
jgi:hypothetical protein